MLGGGDIFQRGGCLRMKYAPILTMYKSGNFLLPNECLICLEYMFKAIRLYQYMANM